MKCKQCKDLFDPTRKNAQFCSPRCSEIYWKNYRENWKDKHTNVETDYTKAGIRAYNNIKQRTGNPNHPAYPTYGGRGIKLELTKEEFVEIYFSTDKCEMCGQKVNDENRMGATGRTLDRIDVHQGYKKGNLRILCRACNCSLAHRRRRGFKD